MEKLRVSFLAAVVVPIVTSFSCGGSDNPTGAANGNKDASTSGNGTGGSGNGTGGSSMGSSGMAGTMGAAGSGFMLPPPETIVPDPTCPGLNFTVPDGGFALPDGGRFTIPDGGIRLPDGGRFTLPSFPGCCDKTGVCGFAIQQGSFTQCVTPADAKMFGRGNVDAGASKPCNYPKM